MMSNIKLYDDAADIPGALGCGVDVYFNLTKSVWSVRSVASRRVIGHCKFVALSGVKFLVSEPGRQRVLRDKRKNVHAYCRGLVVQGSDCPRDSMWHYVAYNPYKVETFCLLTGGLLDTDKPVYRADYVLMETLVCALGGDARD